MAPHGLASLSPPPSTLLPAPPAAPAACSAADSPEVGKREARNRVAALTLALSNARMASREASQTCRVTPGFEAHYLNARATQAEKDAWVTKGVERSLGMFKAWARVSAASAELELAKAALDML